MQKSPSEIILARAEAYNKSDPKLIYEMYSEKSDFKSLFPTYMDYKQQFFELTKIYGSIKSKIISEKIKKNIAEVIYTDTVISSEKEIYFYCKGYFVLTKDGWKINKEKKEIVGK